MTGSRHAGGPMDRPAGTSQGPRRAALVALAIAALAGIATSPTPPTAKARVVGEIGIDGGTSQTRELRIHLAPPIGKAPTMGDLAVGLQSAADFGPVYATAIDISITDPGDALVGPAASSTNVAPLPVDTCAAGCDLTYLLTFAAHDDLGPAASFRFQAIVTFTWGDYTGRPAGLRVETSGGGDSAPPIGWLLIVGAMLAGLLAGLAIGPSIPPRARRIPARMLIGILLVFGAWPLVVYGLFTIVPDINLSADLAWPYQETIAVGWFAAVLLLALAVGLMFGLRRVDRDGGWLLGLATVGTIALGGVWLGWMIGSFAILRPVVMTVGVAGLGCLLGIVVQGAWGGGRVAIAGRRLWPSLAIASQGFLIAGLVYAGLVGLEPTPFSSSQPIALVPLVPALVVAVGAWRWFLGSRWLMVLVNLALLAIGLLGTFLVSGFGGLEGTSSSGTVPVNAFVIMEVAAAFVGLVTATQRFGGGSASPAHQEPASAPDDPDLARLAT
jgi:hypothetical protein